MVLSYILSLPLSETMSDNRRSPPEFVTHLPLRNHLYPVYLLMTFGKKYAIPPRQRTVFCYTRRWDYCISKLEDGTPQNFQDNVSQPTTHRYTTVYGSPIFSDDE